MRSEKELGDKGVEFELINLGQVVHSVHDVQVACKCEASEVIKTLLMIGESPIMIVLPGDKRANISRIKEFTGEQNLRMAKPAEVLAITGYSVGSVSPFGVSPSIRQVADNSVRALGSLFMGSGKNDVLIKMGQAEFNKAFRGTFAGISD